MLALKSGDGEGIWRRGGGGDMETRRGRGYGDFSSISRYIHIHRYTQTLCYVFMTVLQFVSIQENNLPRLN